MTEEEKIAYNEKKKIAAQAYKERQKEAKDTIRNYLKDFGADLPEDVKKAMEYLTGSGQRIARVGGNSVLATFRQRMIEKGAMSGVEIFTEFEWGTPTVRTKVKELVKKYEGDERVWVVFEAGNWVVKGTGDEAPKGCEHLMPKEKAEKAESDEL